MPSVDTAIEHQSASQKVMVSALNEPSNIEINTHYFCCWGFLNFFEHNIKSEINHVTESLKFSIILSPLYNC